jgi:hypothetical protein
MTDRLLTISFGGAHPAKIVRVEHLAWPDIAQIFLQPAPEAEDKAAAGWYAFAEFDPAYRDSDNLVARHALTFDYDHVTHADVKHIRKMYADLEYVMYTTASHTAEKPRLRMLLPLSRPAGYDEFQAVSRKIAERAGIELCAREAQVPAQMMYMPTVKPGGIFRSTRNAGAWVDVDVTLAMYGDWTDRKSWPKRKDGDGTHAKTEVQIAPGDKPGLIGAFNRAFTISAAIEKFGLPFERVGE